MDLRETVRLVPTHKVSFYGIRCYFNCQTGHLWGVNKACDRMIKAAALFHNCMTAITQFFLPQWGQPGFPLKIIKEYPSTRRQHD